MIRYFRNNTQSLLKDLCSPLNLPGARPMDFLPFIQPHFRSRVTVNPPELLTKAIWRLSGDQQGTFMVP